MKNNKVKGYIFFGHSVESPQLAPGLHIVATPIGNLRDITIRALETLAGADMIACEDTRVTRKLLVHYGISTPLMPYHEHNAAVARPKVLGRLAQGDVIALVSDAGTPLISDPGFKLVRAACEAGHLVITEPGACAAIAALTVSGIATDRFFFEGFLPSKNGQRRSRIAELSAVGATLIFYESGARIARTLAALAEGLGERNVAVCRELTKLHEEVRRGSLAALAQAYAQGAETRGEFTIVVEPLIGAIKQTNINEVEAMLRVALQKASMKDAVSEVTSATGRSRREVYRLALAIMNDGDDEEE